MDRATGGSFFSCLLQEHQDGTMPPSAVCQVAKDILRTLSILHGEGILHRDIKPDNLALPRIVCFRGWLGTYGHPGERGLLAPRRTCHLMRSSCTSPSDLRIC
eukprot:g20460.t1